MIRDLAPLIAVLVVLLIAGVCIFIFIFHPPWWELTFVCPVDHEVFTTSTPICDKHDAKTDLKYVRWHYDFEHLRLWPEVHK